ncbi:MAG: hypothetical protein JSS30_05715 [Verrucomicrobia bacterium]|nr:hypothetical protein [Verrucomicrobiota bacterium]
MLGFFRKYQKGFFIVVTFFIVVSFVFFGTYGAFTKSESMPDREIGHLVDGSVLKEQKLHALLRLLQYGAEEGGHNVNLLSDSLVHRELILSGLGEMLAEHHFDEIKEEMAARWKRAKHYSPYVHPYNSAISAKNVWSQYCPKMIGLLEEVKKAPEEFSKEQLPLLFALYAAQADFPPQLLHQMLYYNQGQQTRPDPGLPQANVALFGFETVSDWFGEKFVEEIGKLILNCACIAREEGYKVSKEEARIDLYSNVYRGLKAYSQGKTLTNEEAEKVFNQQIRMMGLDENLATNLWREVLCFRRMFDEVGNAVFVDSLAYNQFKSFAKPAQRICRYSLPHHLQFANFREMVKFQRYLEIVAAGDFVDLPKSLKRAEEVMNRHPELAYKEFEIEVATATKEDAAAQVSLKETWKWEGENFDQLRKEFPSIVNCKSAQFEDRMDVLDKLDEATRFKVDQFARMAIVDADSSRIDAALASARGERQRVKVALGKVASPFSGQHFLGLLEVEDPALNRYSVDGETFYAIRVLDKGKGWNLFSFEEADMDQVLDKFLLTAYKDTSDQSAAKMYADLLKSIDIKTNQLDDYAKHRFDRYLSAMRKLAIENPAAFEEAQSGLWALVAREEIVNEPTLAVGDFSTVKEGQFFKLLENVENKATDAEIASVKEHLKRDAEQELMRKLLKRL